jgi:phenylpropionate dioxygenase-like ring-hydroxylating dioxygenase large terminal subunit
MATAARKTRGKRNGGPGEARARGFSVQDVYRAEMGEVPEIFQEHWRYLGSKDIPKDRYITTEWHEAEVEKMWSRTWQFACREDELPNVGDQCVYEMPGRRSVLLVRVEPNLIKAYWNACLHRGTMLRNSSGYAPELRCPFHGWTWKLDGSLKGLHCPWDLAHIDPERMSLPELRVARWGGFVFVNADADAEPFEDYASPLPEHWKRWPLAGQTKVAHVTKVLRANWKVAMEAFLEGYHAPTTHPQGMGALSESNIQHDLWKNVARLIYLQGIPSPECPEALSEQEILDLNLKIMGLEEQLELPQGMTARSFVAEMARAQSKTAFGPDFPSYATDAEHIDFILYTLFPNFIIWGGFVNPVVYRFTPYDDDPQMCLMEVIRFAQNPSGKKSTDCRVTWLGVDQTFLEAPELGVLLATVMHQDAGVLDQVQGGLRTTCKPGITLADYQESIVRHHNEVLDEYVLGAAEHVGGAG